VSQLLRLEHSECSGHCWSGKEAPPSSCLLSVDAVAAAQYYFFLPQSVIVTSVAGNNNCVIVSRQAAKPLHLLLPDHSEYSGHCWYLFFPLRAGAR